MRNLIYGIVLYGIGQSLIWFQSNGQFIWPFFKRNPLLIAFIGGTGVSYMFIKATAMVAEYYDGLVWPGRFLGFSIGILSFAFLTHHLLGEGINIKTGVSLALAFALIAVQIFWK